MEKPVPSSSNTRRITAGPLRGAALCISGLLAPFAASAQTSPALDRVSLAVGGFHAEPKFGTRVGTSLGTFDTGDIERDSVNIPRLKAEVLFFGNHGLSFDYYKFSEDYVGDANRSTVIGGVPINATADARVGGKIEVAKLAYKWWLGSGDTAIGLGAGAGYYRAAFDGNASVTVNGLTRTATANDSEDAVAPLLELGLRHAFRPDLRVFADASGIWKKRGRINGEIYNAALGVEWFPVTNVGLVLAYEVSNVTLNRQDADATRLRVKLAGPSAYVKVRF